MSWDHQPCLGLQDSTTFYRNPMVTTSNIKSSNPILYTENTPMSFEQQESEIPLREVNIVVDCVDEMKDGEDEIMVDIGDDTATTTRDRYDLVNALLKSAYMKKEEFVRLLDEHAELVRKINIAESKLT